MADPKIMDVTGGRPASQGGAGAPHPHKGVEHGAVGEHLTRAELDREIAGTTRRIADAEHDLALKRQRLAHLHTLTPRG